MLGKGKTAAATAALEKTVELIQSRERTNAEISSADAAVRVECLSLARDALNEW